MSDLIAIQPDPLQIDAAVQFVADPRAGAVATFLGNTRAETSAANQSLAALDYEAYTDMALKQLHELARQARQRWPILRLAILHRTGRVEIAQPSVLIAVSTPHRSDAFDACRWIIDTLKRDVAIWKKEVWSDGSSSWIHPTPPK